MMKEQRTAQMIKEQRTAQIESLKSYSNRLRITENNSNQSRINQGSMIFGSIYIVAIIASYFAISISPFLPIAIMLLPLIIDCIDAAAVTYSYSTSSPSKYQAPELPAIGDTSVSPTLCHDPQLYYSIFSRDILDGIAENSLDNQRLDDQ